MSAHHMVPRCRRHTALRVWGCAVLGGSGGLSTLGCLLALLLAHLRFFGERPQVPVLHALVLLASAVAGIGVPALVTALVLDTWRQRLVIVAVMPAVLLLGVLSVVGVLGW